MIKYQSQVGGPFRQGGRGRPVGGAAPGGRSTDRARQPRSRPRRTSVRSSHSGSGSACTRCRTPTSNCPPGRVRNRSSWLPTWGSVRSTQPTTPATSWSCSASARSSSVSATRGRHCTRTVAIQRPTTQPCGCIGDQIGGTEGTAQSVQAGLVQPRLRPARQVPDVMVRVDEAVARHGALPRPARGDRRTSPATPGASRR